MGERTGLVGVIGLGEVGHVLIGELTRVGQRTVGVDLRNRRSEGRPAAAIADIPVIGPASQASLAELDALFVAVPGSAALGVVKEIAPHLQRATPYIDLTTKDIADRDALADVCAAQGLAFADGALLDTVTWPERGIDLVVSGPGASHAVSILRDTAFSVWIVDEDRCCSAEIKLARSTFTKGLSGLLIECFCIGERLNVLPILVDGVEKILSASGGEIIDLLVGSALRHATRRAAESASSASFAQTVLGAAPMSLGTSDILHRLAAVASDSTREVPTSWTDVIAELSASAAFRQ